MLIAATKATAAVAFVARLSSLVWPKIYFLNVPSLKDKFAMAVFTDSVAKLFDKASGFKIKQHAIHGSSVYLYGNQDNMLKGVDEAYHDKGYYSICHLDLNIGPDLRMAAKMQTTVIPQ